MSQSQLQCLNEYHINLRTNESKPEFLYSELQRLALERLLDEGPDHFQEFINTNRIRPFLSDLEIAHMSASVQPYCSEVPDYSTSYDGDRTGSRVSVQYWPECSDDSLPQLELGWPQCVNYRGVTRVAVHAQPPLHGNAPIKEVVRRIIARAQKVIAVVMDLFTDVDIFKDLLYASAKRNVAVYIILEITGVPHFLKMCESASMHTGHLKNLRVRSIRGTDFFTHSSKKVCGSQSQKFMYVDGDKAVSGSYSFTWTASRLDRSIITVLTGQAVDFFDQLFQDLYMMSRSVDLDKISLENEQKIEPIFKEVPAVQPSITMALKLINPKYALVSSGNNAAVSHHVATEIIKESPESPRVHPGLLHLERANMIDYLPAWPEPDPPSDVIGFINIRDWNKPLQAHLTRSELYKVSQAIRFKEPIHKPPESLSERFGPSHTSPNAALAREYLPQTKPEENYKHCNPPQQAFPPSSLTEQAPSLSASTNPQTSHSSLKRETDSAAEETENQTDVVSTQREEPDFGDISTHAESCEDSQITDNVQSHSRKPFDSVGSNIVTTRTPTVQPETSSNIQANQWNTNQWKITQADPHGPDHGVCTVHNETSSYSYYRSSISSEECSESVTVDHKNVAMVNEFPVVSTTPDKSKSVRERSSSLLHATCENSSVADLEKSKLTSTQVQNLELTSANRGRRLSGSGLKTNEQQIQETDSVLQAVATDAQVRAHDNTECLQDWESCSVVRHMFEMQPVEGFDCAELQLLIDQPLLQDKEAVSLLPVRKSAAAQCIVFSDTTGSQ